jgi:hypothetical protein
MVCPNDCSGKGTCQSTKYLTANPVEDTTAWYNSVPTQASYPYWDGEMAMSCKCDPGYTGPDCSVRMCPVGDDMLTQTDQVYETQFIDIFSDCEGTRSGGDTTGCPTAAAGTVLGGSVTITYTDHFGEKYTTEPIDGLAAYEGTDTTFAANAQAALRALPNNVFSQTATVHSTFCEYLEASQSSYADGVVTVGATTPHAHASRVVGPATCITTVGNYVFNPDGTVAVVGSAMGGLSLAKAAAGASATCALADVSSLPTPQCTRLVVSFNGMPGDQPNLAVNVAEATFNGKTNAQDSGSHVGATVTSRLQISSADTTVGYDAPSSITVTSSDVYITAGASSTTVTFDSALLAQATTSTFQPTTTVKIECGGTGPTWRNLGDFTVASSTDTVLTISEVIPASTIHTDCGSSDGATTHHIRVTMVSHVIRSGLDAATGTVAADTMVDLGLILANLRGTNALSLKIGATLGNGKVYEWASFFLSSSDADTLSSAADAAGGIAILASEATSSFGKNGHHTGGNAESAGTILGSPTLADALAIAANTLSTDATGAFYIDGDGTMENVECGARGLCDTEAGECKCFPGYVGLSCSQQNALAA